MDGIDTKVFKSLHLGWMAESRIPMEGDRVLKIVTNKVRGGVGSFARAVAIKGDMESFLMFGDFSKPLGARPARATEKAVREIHAAVLAGAEALKAEAASFYAAKVERGAS